MVDLLVVVGGLAIIVFVFASGPRRERAIKRMRARVLDRLAPVVSGSISDVPEVTGTYKGYSVDVSLRKIGRIDSIGDHQSEANTFEVILVVLRGAPGSQPWGFYTSLVNRAPLSKKWQSTTAFAGALGKVLSRLSPMPIDPTTDDRLRAGGMLEQLEQLEPPGSKSRYIMVSYTPDGAATIDHVLSRVEAVRPDIAERARREADRHLERERGGHLRIEIERDGDADPTSERFREILDAAIAIAQLNATINPPAEHRT